ncbi:hypothetical protein [Actinosynnema sp. ALI-1.44]|uniref:hypothetical protein n=1 Tax=Actinosynnema sp. ALI-1.44 TaxID=1933779 RepID=UPI001177B7A2|nr:hypothetical protein [Actinosynnema sp. ALI-1.44]
MTDEQARQLWRAEGWPEEGIDFMLTMWATVPPMVGIVTPVVKEVTGRSPRTFAERATQHARQFA